MKKYSPIGELREFASQYAESLSQTTGHIVCIVDKDQIIAVSGTQKKELMAKSLSEELEEAIDSRENISAERSDKKYIHITSDQQDEYSAEIITPIICEGDAIGAVVMLSKDGKIKFGETEQKLAMTAAGFLGRQMES